MVILSSWTTNVNVSGFSALNDVNDYMAWDAPEDIDISLHYADKKNNPVFCPRRYHCLYEESSTGKITVTKTYEKKKMKVHDSRRRSAIVLADLRSCKRGNAYDIFKLNGPNADIQEILTNSNIRTCKIWFHVPDYYCPFCDEENARNPMKYLPHYHRAVPEWMIWLHQLTMIVQLYIMIGKVQQFLKDLDYDTSRGWIREGKRMWQRIKTNSMIENLVELIDPDKQIIQDGKKATVFWIYYIVPPWMKTLIFHYRDS